MRHHVFKSPDSSPPPSPSPVGYKATPAPSPGPPKSFLRTPRRRDGAPSQARGRPCFVAPEPVSPPAVGPALRVRALLCCLEGGGGREGQGKGPSATFGTRDRLFHIVHSGGPHPFSPLGSGLHCENSQRGLALPPAPSPPTLRCRPSPPAAPGPAPGRAREARTLRVIPSWALDPRLPRWRHPAPDPTPETCASLALKKKKLPRISLCVEKY